MWRKKQQPRMLRPLASAPVDDGAVHVVLALPMPATALDAFKAAFTPLMCAFAISERPDHLRPLW